MLARPTALPIRPEVRDGLRRFGTAGMTYSDIVTAVQDRIERERFVAHLRCELDDPATEWVEWDEIGWD